MTISSLRSLEIKLKKDELAEERKKTVAASPRKDPGICLMKKHEKPRKIMYAV
jgi:hypothetical protein